MRLRTHLCTVSEVTELGLPEYKGVGVLKRIAELVAKDTKLRERGVADCEHALLLAHARHIIQGAVLPTCFLVCDYSMTVREGSALDVLRRASANLNT